MIRTPLPMLLAVPLIVVVLAGGMYVVAERAASVLASTLSTEETLHYTRAVESEAAMTRASAEHRAARAGCARLDRGERDNCSTVANRRQGAATRGAIVAGSEGN
jgi:hypothetical protein